MAKTFLISTVAAGTVTINDLGARAFTHPVAAYDLTSEYSLEEIRESEDLKAAIQAGNLTADFDGVAITSAALFDNYIVDFDRKQVVQNTSDISTLSGASHTQGTDLGLDTGGANPVTAATITAFIASKGAVSGLASLDAGGKVPASQLPSYVDDVEEYANLAAFPVTGETGKIYVAIDTGKIYRWSGSIYVEISPSVAKKSFTYSAGEDGNLNGSRDLIRTGGMRTNLTPFVVPVASTVWGISIASQQGTNVSFQVQVLVNGSAVITKTVTTTDKLFSSAETQALVAGDEIRIRFIKTTDNIVNLGVELYCLES